MEQFRDELNAMKERDGKAQAERQDKKAAAPQASKRKTQRSKRLQSTGAIGQDAPDGARGDNAAQDGGGGRGAGPMRPAECERELLRRLAAMPFLDRLEMVCVSGWSRGAVYPAVESLESQGFVASVPHATDLVPPTRRFCLTAAGIYRLAKDEGMTVDDLLRPYPVSEQWRRVLLERLDAVAVIYRLASAVSGITHPIRFRWYRAMPMDAALALPDGRVIAVVRQGIASDRTGSAKRLWRLREGPLPGAVLLLAPDEIRLRHARRLMAGAPVTAFLALERDAASAGPDAPIWRLPSGSAVLDLGAALAHTRPRGAWPKEQPLARASLPEDLTDDAPERALRDWLLPTLLKPTEKRVLDLLADWPWITPAHLGALLGVERSMLSRTLARLAGLDLVVDAVIDGGRRLALADRGLALLARRDRAAVGAARRRWSPALLDPKASLTWRNVSGRRSRQLLRNLEHTQAVHWFLAVLARQARSRGYEIVQLDPPRRASRFFRHGDRLYSVHPDAFGILRKDGRTWPFSLEWERRAVRPVTMADRIAPYLRYFSSLRPADDHGAQPTLLVVFEDDITATHFLHLATDKMARAKVSVPLWVSHRGLMERVGPLGPAWLAVDSGELVYAF